ncbi:hypothetical protein F4810DRAFT_683189, partial [Camillea tinctor]
MPFNPYRILGVDPNSTPETIKKAYRKLCLRHHPDKAGQCTKAHEAFIKIQNAYETLSNPQSRRVYDRKSRVSTHNRKPRNPAGSRRGQYPVNPNVNTSETPVLRSRIGASDVLEGMSIDVSRLQKRFSNLLVQHTLAHLKQFGLTKGCVRRNMAAIAELKGRMRTIPLGSWKDTPEIRQFVSSMYELKDEIDKLKASISWAEVILREVMAIES